MPRNKKLITSAKRIKCSSCFLASNQNKRVAIWSELRYENGQNMISHSQLKKSKISLVKKFQTVYLFPKLYLKSR